MKIVCFINERLRAIEFSDSSIPKEPPVRISDQKQTCLSRRGGRFVISGDEEEEEFPADDEFEEFEDEVATALPPL